MNTPTLHGARRLTLAAALVAAVAPAQATENGAPITPIGVFDFGAGMLPPPTEVGAIGLRAASARATQTRDNNSDRAPVEPDLAVNAYSVVFIKMTNTMFGGARYGWGAILPYLDMSLDLRVPTPAGPLALSGRNRAIGDVMLMPVMLQWTPAPGLFTNFQLSVQAPTGSYNKTRLINAGTNHWTLAPSIAVTSISQGGFELSTNIQLNINSRNKDTDYRSGIEYQHEFAVGQHIGPWTAGVGGYFYQQLTDDSAPGLLNGNRSRVAALGPAVSFFDPASGLPSMWLHAYKEFAARNRSQGTHVAIRAAWAF